MQLSEAWLREWANPSWDSATLADRLTMGGLEVESRVPAAPAFSGVVVARIVECTRHPKADKLSLCVVSADGKERLQVVCGAPNARAGLVTALARVGATLPGGTQIKATMLREVESHGMLCSARELGLGDDGQGILELDGDLELGRDLRAALALDDMVLTVNVTPNRGDALSVLGIARETAALAAIPLAGDRLRPVPPASDGRFPVRLSARDACAKFVGRVIRGVDARKPSPLWLRERLRRSGLRAINPIVDVTNYVMLELGTPMHAYDLARLDAGIDVRRARARESITLLDGETRELDPSVLVIADGGGAVGLAGVMGGAHSAVSALTTDVFFEAAFFEPRGVSVTARRFGLITDAAQRFERGVDSRAQERGVERATQLLLEIAGGTAGPTVVTQVEEKLPRASAIDLRRTQLARLIGMTVPDARARSALEALGMRVESVEQGWRVTPPSHRFDLSIEADLVEEVARVVGYEQVPEIHALVPQVSAPLQEAEVTPERALQLLADRGYQEAITYTFVDPKVQGLLFPGVSALELTNPIAADMSVMRVSLWPGLLTVARENLRRQQQRVRLVEYGRKFAVDGASTDEIDTVSGVVFGSTLPEQWGEKARATDFFDVKADLQALLDATGAGDDFSFAPDSLPCLHPGRAARITRGGHEVGWLGELHPELLRALDLTYAPIVFELETEAALVGKIPDFEEFSRFPSIRRDLAVVVDEATPLEALREHVSVSANKLLRDLRVFDVYRGPGVESGRKSVALGLILQETTRTLTDQDADQIVAAVVERLRRELNASIRDQ
jgi:phenylalanyl-tRNA synthetase beta chain